MDRDEYDKIPDSVDPGELPVEEVPSGEEESDFPDAQIIVDQETGQAFIAFEIDPSSIPEEENGEEGGEEK
jgi:hypothetical protein